VRIFTTWEQSIDSVSRRLLEANAWTMPKAGALPTGAELCDLYLTPLSRVPAMAAAIETGAKVLAVSRQGIDKVASNGARRSPSPCTCGKRTAMRGSIRSGGHRCVGHLQDSIRWRPPDLPADWRDMPAPRPARHAGRAWRAAPLMRSASPVVARLLRKSTCCWTW